MTVTDILYTLVRIPDDMQTNIGEIDIIDIACKGQDNVCIVFFHAKEPEEDPISISEIVESLKEVKDTTTNVKSLHLEADEVNREWIDGDFVLSGTKRLIFSL